MTPRVEWTWNNFRASAAIRRHCRAFCRCHGGQKKGSTRIDPSIKLWRFTDDMEWLIGHSQDGSVKLLDASGSDGASFSVHTDSGNTVSKYSFTILPPQTNGPVSGSCGADGKQFCPMPWPKDLLGPIPLSPPEFDDISHLSDDLSLPLVPYTDSCSTSCTGPSQCQEASTPFCPFRLRCAVDPSILSQDVGLAIGTLILIGASQCVRKNTRRASAKLGGRSVIDGGVDDRQARGRAQAQNQALLDWPCACNASYVSHACCQVDNGLVWEDGRRSVMA
jgi:hypothetical protein